MCRPLPAWAARELSLSSTRLGKNPASVLPPPVGAISSTERPAWARRQQFELMVARRPAAAGEPAAENFRQQRRRFGALLQGGHGSRRPHPMTYLTRMRPEDILVPTSAGVCCKIGGFHIDPVRPVDKAVITHGHSDHARAGHGSVLATQETLDLMRLRYGENFAGATQPIRYGETLSLGGARITFHPAGHVLGSAQVAVECKDLRVVASGDYKDVPDPTCPRFRAGEMRRLHHRGDVRPAGVSPRQSGGRDRQAVALGRTVSRARASGRRLFARQGATGDRADPAGRLRPPDLHAWRAGDDHALLRKPRHCARRGQDWRAMRERPSSPAPSRCARLRPCRKSGRDASPIRSPALPPAGCACARGHASAACNCRW